MCAVAAAGLTGAIHTSTFLISGVSNAPAVLSLTSARPSNQVVPVDGMVTVYAYDHVSLLHESTGMVTVDLNAADSRALLEVLNSLPHGASARCEENELVYRLSVRVPGERTLTHVAGWACNAAVLIAVGGSPRPTLKDVSCGLFHKVVSDLPPNGANGTRHATIDCRA
jgi:hypothetical protein